MTKDAKATGISLVIDQGMSINSAAKMVGIPMSTLRLAVVNHPDYEKAKSSGKLKAPIPKSSLTDEELLRHPAVLAVVNDGMSYDAAAKLHGVSTMTLYGWVKRVFPDKFAARARPQHIEADSDQHNAVLDVLTAQLQASATQLNTTPEQLLAVLSARLTANKS